MLVESVQSPFIFATCQIGAEPALKAELGRLHPKLRFAFSRPGFVTFRGTDPLGPELELGSAFARAYGLSHGRLDERFAPRAEWAGHIVRLARIIGQGNPVRLHVWSRDLFPPGEEPMGFDPALGRDQAQMIEAELRGAAGKGVFSSDAPTVLDVIRVEDGEWWLGSHHQGPAHSPWAGGLPRIELPPEAPSRAFLKLEESVQWSGAPLRAGDTAVEIGSAPGGAAYALLKRGLNVVGIDPGEMAPQVLNFGPSRFQHIARPIGQVGREELPDEVHWLLLDMNVEPRISVVAADRIGTRMMDGLLGILLTMKLNEWKMAAQLPEMLERVRQIGMARVRAAQLSHHRQELLIYGLTRKGLMR